MRLANYRAFSQYSTSCTKLKIPKFAPDHSLRTGLLNSTIGLFVREFALSDVGVLIKIPASVVIHIISKCTTPSRFMAIYGTI